MDGHWCSNLVLLQYLLTSAILYIFINREKYFWMYVNYFTDKGTLVEKIKANIYIFKRISQVIRSIIIHGFVSFLKSRRGWVNEGYYSLQWPRRKTPWKESLHFICTFLVFILTSERGLRTSLPLAVFWVLEREKIVALLYSFSKKYN